MTTKPKSYTTPELSPCPFCGSSDVKIVTDDGIHFAQCCKCEATGPTGFKRGEEGDADWNNRTQPADQQGEPYAYAYEHDGMIHNELHPPTLTVSRWPEVKEPFTEIALYRQAQPATAKVDEYEEFEKAYQSVIDNGWINVKHMARQVWQARAKLNGGQS